MARRHHRPYAPEFRAQMVELAWGTEPGGADQRAAHLRDRLREPRGARERLMDEAFALADLAKLMTSEDAREGPRAFVEKRKPVWKGR